jgi:hypothetical protein
MNLGFSFVYDFFFPQLLDGAHVFFYISSSFAWHGRTGDGIFTTWEWEWTMILMIFGGGGEGSELRSGALGTRTVP